VDNSVYTLYFLIVNKKIPFFSGTNFTKKNWLIIILLSIVVFTIGAVIIALIIAIGEVIKTTTSTGTVLSARKEYAGSFCV